MRKSLFFVFLPLFFLGCTSAPLTIRPEGCRTQALYSSFDHFRSGEVKELKSKYWSIFGKSNRTISELLEAKDIKCEEIGTLSYEVSQDFFDVMMSLFPGASRGTITLKVQEARDIVYYEPIQITQTPILEPRDEQEVFTLRPRDEVEVRSFRSKRRTHLGVFYESIQGGFSQTDLTSNAGSDLDQGSPIGFGIQGSLGLGESFDLSTRLSLSKISPANFGEFGEADLPFEMNFQAHLRYRTVGTFTNFLMGIDHERFSLFNNTGLQLGDDVETFATAVTFLSFGFQRSFDLVDLPASLSFAGGPSIFSSSEYEVLEGEGLSGLKFQVMFQFSPAPFWNTYLSYKQINLQGDAEVAVDRLGIGLSYDFF